MGGVVVLLNRFGFLQRTSSILTFYGIVNLITLCFSQAPDVKNISFNYKIIPCTRIIIIIAIIILQGIILCKEIFLTSGACGVFELCFRRLLFNSQNVFSLNLKLYAKNLSEPPSRDAFGIWYQLVPGMANALKKEACFAPYPTV